MPFWIKISLCIGIFFFLPSEAESQDYKVYNSLLKNHVDAKGNVNYKQLLKEKKSIDQVLSEWSKIKTSQLHPKARLALYLNLYNLSTLKVILEHYPVKSIKDIKGGKIWDSAFIPLNGALISLNELENEFIRKAYKEPRIHFLLNCGAKSCPPLYQEAFTEKNVDALMETRTQLFINDGRSNVIKQNQVKLCKIFEWYKSDFGDLIVFINKYSKAKVKNNAQILFLEYNWDLNQP